MFTGIIQEIGTIQTLNKKNKGLTYSVLAPNLSIDAKLGASISIDGACQTITKIEGETLYFDAIDESLKKTIIGNYKIGSKVHLEPAMQMKDRFDGHIVYGHIDSTTTVKSISTIQNRYDISVYIPDHLIKYTLHGGSICLNGVSLTIYKKDPNSCSVSLIPETLLRTNFTQLKPGSQINLEVDSIGKWIESLYQKEKPSSSLEQSLRSNGFY